MRTPTYLARRDYPGRVVVVHCSDNSSVTVTIAQTGRSEASRERIITRVGTDTLRVGPKNPDAPVDELRHYDGIIARGHRLFAGNGTQVLDVANHNERGLTVEQALLGFKYEDDSLRTPRITSVVNMENMEATFGIAFCDGNRRSAQRVQRYELVPNSLWLMHTYTGRIDNLQSGGYLVQLPSNGDGEVEARQIWDSLNSKLRVAAASVTAHKGSDWAAGDWSIINH